MTRSTPQAIEIYSAYPRRVKKPAALRAILNAIERDGFEKVRDATNAYAKRVQEVGRELQFVPYPATFFNGEMYNDDLDALLPKVNGHKVVPASLRLKAAQSLLEAKINTLKRTPIPDPNHYAEPDGARFHREHAAAVEKRSTLKAEIAEIKTKIEAIQKEML